MRDYGMPARVAAGLVRSSQPAGR